MAAGFRPLDWTGFGPWQSWAQVLDSFPCCLASCRVSGDVLNRAQSLEGSHNFPAQHLNLG